MKTKVRVTPQVEQFLQSLAPEPRRRLRQAVKNLADDRGDIKNLEGRLAGYHRLRVAGYRVIFKEHAVSGVRVLDCVFAERRALVYEIFLKLLAEQVVS